MIDEQTINIRAIQHYMYCPRRFALLEINNDWAENAFVVKANLLHERVHSGEHDFKSKEKTAKSSIAVYNDDYNIFGITDCIEFIPNKKGIFIDGMEGAFKVRIVEYKPKAPKDQKYHESDSIQLFAQKLCADYIWKTDSEAFIYYADIKRRVKIPFDDKEISDYYDNMIKDFLNEMRNILVTNSIPPRRKSQKCSGCSLHDYCFSKVKTYSVKEKIKALAKTEVE